MLIKDGTDKGKDHQIIRHEGTEE